MTPLVQFEHAAVKILIFDLSHIEINHISSTHFKFTIALQLKIEFSKQ